MGLPKLAQTLIKKVASLKDRALSTILTDINQLKDKCPNKSQLENIITTRNQIKAHFDGCSSCEEGFVRDTFSVSSHNLSSLNVFCSCAISLTFSMLNFSSSQFLLLTSSSRTNSSAIFSRTVMALVD
jgi:hypothetical protein